MWAIKYRPRQLKSVLGQELVKRLISGILLKRSEGKSCLLTGPHGIGKTTFVRILAKGLICPHQQENGEGCGQCSSCKAVDQEDSLNYIEVDAASFGSAEKIRELIASAHLAPSYEDSGRVIALDEVHALSSAAQDVLLKILEEPPSNTHFILSTTNQEKIKNTIISRCVHLRLNVVDKISITNHLEYICQQENVPYELEALTLIAEQKHGHVRDAIVVSETVSLTGGVYLDNVKNYLGLDLRDESFKLINSAFKDWNETLEVGKVVCEKFYPDQIWDNVKSIFLEADFIRRFPMQYSSGHHAEYLVSILGDKLSNSTEWIFLKGKHFHIDTYADLMISVALLLDQVGMIQQSSGAEQNPIRGGLHRRAEGNASDGEQITFEEFADKLGFIIED